VFQQQTTVHTLVRKATVIAAACRYHSILAEEVTTSTCGRRLPRVRQRNRVGNCCVVGRPDMTGPAFYSSTSARVRKLSISEKRWRTCSMINSAQVRTRDISQMRCKQKLNTRRRISGMQARRVVEICKLFYKASLM
jgi:hypothetical protein